MGKKFSYNKEEVLKIIKKAINGFVIDSICEEDYFKDFEIPYKGGWIDLSILVRVRQNKNLRYKVDSVECTVSIWDDEQKRVDHDLENVDILEASKDILI